MIIQINVFADLFYHQVFPFIVADSKNTVNVQIVYLLIKKIYFTVYQLNKLENKMDTRFNLKFFYALIFCKGNKFKF